MSSQWCVCGCKTKQTEIWSVFYLETFKHYQLDWALSLSHIKAVIDCYQIGSLYDVAPLTLSCEHNYFLSVLISVSIRHIFAIIPGTERSPLTACYYVGSFCVVVFHVKLLSVLLLLLSMNNTDRKYKHSLLQNSFDGFCSWT